VLSVLNGSSGTDAADGSYRGQWEPDDAPASLQSASAMDKAASSESETPSETTWPTRASELSSYSKRETARSKEYGSQTQTLKMQRRTSTASQQDRCWPQSSVRALTTASKCAPEGAGKSLSSRVATGAAAAPRKLASQSGGPAEDVTNELHGESSSRFLTGDTLKGPGPGREVTKV
jgi:hypothetical protein